MDFLLSQIETVPGAEATTVINTVSVVDSTYKPRPGQDCYKDATSYTTARQTCTENE